MFAPKLISRKACGPTRSENAQRLLVWVYCNWFFSSVWDFIALEFMESELKFYNDYSREFLLCSTIHSTDAHVLRMRFGTRTTACDRTKGKTKRKKKAEI